jgi:hypothetical protein
LSRSPGPLSLLFLVLLGLPLLWQGGHAAERPPGEPGPQNLPEYRIADADAARVTADDLLASERFWPYQVAIGMDGPWQPPEGKPLRPGTRGVLIRIEEGGIARIDFGRHGVHDVPVAKTDLLEQANRIRSGSASKMAPNYVLAIGPRLVDPSGEVLRAFPLREVLPYRAFLSVFADPQSEAFAALAEALARFRSHPGALTVLFPEGEGDDAAIGERLRALGWSAPFVYQRLAPSYAKGLLREGTPRPALLLSSAEGRVLLARSWTEESAPELATALQAALEAAAPTGDAPAGD